MAESVESENEMGFLTGIFYEMFFNPINLFLVGVISFLAYKIFRNTTQSTTAKTAPVEPTLPRLRRDFTVQELKQYDGNQPDGRILVAVNGNVYDVTKGKRFYGPGNCLFTHLIPGH